MRSVTTMTLMRKCVLRVLAAVALTLGSAVSATDAAAQLAADASWRTITSQHFRVTFESDLEPLARHAAATAERAHAALAVLVADAPRGTIDIVIADNIDLSNGYATPFPSNRIVIYAKPPVDVLELQYTRDWIELVVTHELAHIFHLDATSGFGRLVRTIFGRVPAPWPVFPAIGVPAWSVEGLAVGVESAVTEFGRVHGSYNEMVVRTAALADRMDEFDRLGSSSARWPGGQRVYVYGSMFMDYLTRRYGADAAARVVRNTAGAVIPPPLWFGNVGRNALGITFRNAYRDWERETVARSDSLAAVLSARGLTAGEPLTGHRAYALHPRFSPDGSRIAYAASDWRNPTELRVIDATTGSKEWSVRVNQPAAAAWLADDRLMTSEVEFVDRFRAFGDLRIVGRNDRRVTRNARLQDADVSRSGSVVAVQNDDGTNRLVRVDSASGVIRSLTEFDPDTHWALPRFSPAGDRIAAARWSTGGASDIVVMDTLGALVASIAGIGVNTAPAWSPDGRWLLFSSDRSGITNLYAADVAVLIRGAAAGMHSEPPLRQVTNVLTGAFQPDVSPDGRWIVYSLYQHDGFRIERMPFDTATWRVPAADGFAHSIAPRVDYDTAAQSTTLLDSVAAALGVADTVAGEVRRYNALRSVRPYFWMPVLESGVVDEATFVGIQMFGRDLIGRHAWDAALAFDVGSGRPQGWLAYTFSGLPTLPGIGLHPTLSAHVERDWDTYIARADDGGLFADEREDVAALTLGLTRQRWRSTTGFSIAGERVRRARYLYDAPADVAFADPRDSMWGVRASAYTARYVTPPLSISREDGYTFQVAVRQRWEDEITTRQTAQGTVTFDAGYRELTTWNTAYVALPLPGFARHVLALRFSGLLRDGAGAAVSNIGGAGGSGFRVAGAGIDLGGASTLLPVRGFRRGARAGNNAWTGSIEYRLPVALIDAPLRPFFFDRISAAAFVDAGHAWCNDQVSQWFGGCASTLARGAPLVSAGGEVTALIGVLGINLPLRAGAGVPLRGSSDTSARFYVLTGSSF